MAVTKKAMLATAGAAGALTIGLAVPAVAFAQEATPTPSASSSAAPGADRQERRAALAEGLAKELGISQDKVAAALEKVESDLAADAKAERQEQLKSRLDEAVKAGKLTQEEADAILKANEAGVLPGGGGWGGGPGGHGGGPR